MTFVCVNSLCQVRLLTHNETSRVFSSLSGVGEHDKVGVISNNRWEWAAVAAACFSLNANMVPMYEAQLASDWTYILNDSGAKVVFCATEDIYLQVRTQVLRNTPSVQESFCFNSALGEQQAFTTALASVAPDTEGLFINPPTPDDLAGLIYTSGTTGKPKGVELSHHNFATNVKAGARSGVDDPHDLIRESDISLAFLPWAHSYGQTCELWAAVSHGAALGIARGIPKILEDLQMVKPTTLFAVPTLYKRIYDGVNNTMETASPIRKNLMKSALAIGRRNVNAKLGIEPPLGPIERLKFKALDSVVLSKIRDRFGGNMRHGYVAGAACPTEVLNFMDNIGIPICEGYGLTETRYVRAIEIKQVAPSLIRYTCSPIIARNTPYKREVGTVGLPVGDTKVYIVDENGNEVPDGQDGEICCTGSNVMQGYYKNPEATAEVITPAPNGTGRMFHTGDLGRKDASGFIRVTGRVKEQYKLENGKYVVPTPIEEAIGLSRFISQVVLTGANRPYNVALLVPEWTAIRTAVSADDSVSEEELANDPRVKELIDHAIASNCSRMKKFEVPQKWAFVAPFTAANSMLTPKMSIRRHKVITTYADIIDGMYGDVSKKASEVEVEEKVA